MIERNLSLIVFFVSATVFSVISHAETKYEAIGNTLKIEDGGRDLRTCKLDEEAIHAVVSFDKSALIVSDTGYVNMRDLKQCSVSDVVHVSHIPEKVGVLSDINLPEGIYVSLDFVTVRPYTWLATVARIASTHNLVSLNGAYIKGKSIKDLQKHSFGGSGDPGTSIIAPSGRYVSPTGDATCSEDSYPGVWDVKENKRVITDQISCSALFSTERN
ncbi:hypothetical protein QCE49_16100 [Caballeronia sp. LZ008]|uniref:hypothetical protein n=1 Tax=unclassified Caballeronia TaxID=2646786 RepID=UPI0020294AB6|nr:MULTISPECIES: hypothetical protein [unclassified Caballeronia]MDR5794897.1 hypothetical protein [Caballeronia sp. LZ008]